MFKSYRVSESNHSSSERRGLRRIMAIAVLLGAGVATLSAQTQVQTQAQVPVQAQPALGIAVPMLDTSAETLFSSSTDEASAPLMASLRPVTVNFAEAMQYGGGRRGGRPRYRGGNTNPDGSAKYTGVVGGGFTQPVGNTYKYLTPSYGFQVGAGRQFNRNVAVLVQFDYDHFGFTGATLGNQQNLYNSSAYQAGISGLDGSSHVWSFTLNPMYTIYSGEGLGAYVVAGVGFYHKTANFTVPATGTYCDYYYGCYQYAANATIDKYTSNAPGFNGGFGLTYKFSRFSNERFFGEVRYVFVDNSQRKGVTIYTANPSPTATNLYPANSNRTGYFPVKFGLRF